MPDRLLLALLVALAWIAFLRAPVDQLYDSRYALALSEQLVRGRATLDPAFPTGMPADATAWNLRLLDGQIRWGLALGTSVLSVPAVGLANALGLALVDPETGYRYEVERRLQRHLAAILMAASVGLVFAIARVWLPPAWSAGVAGVTALGTPIWSTASRGLWSHTWGIFLLSLALLVWLRSRERPTRAVTVGALATLLAWAVFVRPTFVLSWLAIGWLCAGRERRAGGVYLAVSALWLAVFAPLSLAIHGSLLPDYFVRGASSEVAWGVAGLLLSPARGLLVYVPIVLFLAAVALHHWQRVADRRVVAVAAGTIVAHVLAVAILEPRWHGGHCYGPRYLSDVVPWLALGAAAVLPAWREARPGAWSRGVAAALCILSVAMQWPGAWQPESLAWNARPTDVDRDPARLWSWRNPPFLAHWRREDALQPR